MRHFCRNNKQHQPEHPACNFAQMLFICIKRLSLAKSVTNFCQQLNEINSCVTKNNPRQFISTRRYALTIPQVVRSSFR